MKLRAWVVLIPAGIPLIVYPFVLLANVMSLAGHQSAEPCPPALLVASQGFLWSSTLYPVVYVVCARTALAMSRKMKTGLALLLALLPIVYLGIVAAFFAAWAANSP